MASNPMTQGERIRRIQEEANKFVRRTRPTDSGHLTLIRQAQASSIARPTQVTSSIAVDTNGAPMISGVTGAIPDQGCCQKVTIQGKGTNDQSQILAKAQNCAVCADPDISNPANLGVYLNPFCQDRSKPPFTAVDLSGAQVPSCTPGFTVSFPPKIYDGENCNFNRNMTPSA